MLLQQLKILATLGLSLNEDVAVDDVGPVDDQTVDELQLGQLLHLGRQRLAVEVVVVREQRHNLPVTWLGLPRWD